MNNENKIVVITGGGSGLGRSLAHRHHKAGDNICLLGRSGEKLKIAKQKIEENPSQSSILTIPCDVSDEKSVEHAFNKLASDGYSVSCVYNAAGLGLFGDAEDVNKKMIEQLLEANFIGLIMVSTYALKAMKVNGGSIVNIMSSAAKKANPKETVYCGVKWGARGYTESLQAALKGSNINVVAVYPGGMNTPFWKSDCGLTPDVSKFMDPDEVSQVIYEAVSEKRTLKVPEISIDRR